MKFNKIILAVMILQLGDAPVLAQAEMISPPINAPTINPTSDGTSADGGTAVATDSPAPPHQLKVLTLNAWLLAFMGIHIGQDMAARAAIMGRMISQTGADLVDMQEVWPDHDKREIAEEFQSFGYPYYLYVDRGLSLGNGLLIISKYPIVDSAISRPYREVTQDTEIFAKKAGMYAEIAITPTDHVDFFTTHMGALTYEQSEGTYNVNQKARQRTQYLQFRDFIKYNTKNKHVIVAGDFNADYRVLTGGVFQPEYAPDYSSFIQQTCVDSDLTNTFLTANHMDATSTAIPTYDYQHNPYAAGGLFAGAPSETEDYIFECGFAPEQITRSELEFTEPVPADLPELKYFNTVPLRMSDHFSVMTTFQY
jgi:endonuclease/exonuclease/phosphatase family metal-dependent hydrolase